MPHIEFLGIPAAGKTTLVEAVAHGALAADHVIIAPLTRAPVTPAQRLSKRYRDLVSVSLQLLGNPARAVRIWRACSAFRQPSTSMRVRMYLSCLRVDWLARRGAAGTGNGHLVILDQGVYQAVWSLALRAEFDGEDQFLQSCRRLLACLAMPSLVILVDTPPEVARQRLTREPDAHGRLPKLLESDSDWMHRTHQIVESLWRIACNDPLVATFRYMPGTNTPSDIEQAIRQRPGIPEQAAAEA